MVAILWASPNSNGLTAACARAAEKGIASAGGESMLYQLNGLGIGACRACGNGWGTCREGHVCCVEDDFQSLQEEVRRADALIFVTPVYWGEMAEVMKNFTDRLRRCEALRRDDGGLAGKTMLAVAAAGGSGNGTLSCLGQFERMASHLGMKLFDGIPVKRFTRDHQLIAIGQAAAAMLVAAK